MSDLNQEPKALNSTGIPTIFFKERELSRREALKVFLPYLDDRMETPPEESDPDDGFLMGFLNFKGDGESFKIGAELREKEFAGWRLNEMFSILSALNDRGHQVEPKELDGGTVLTRKGARPEPHDLETERLARMFLDASGSDFVAIHWDVPKDKVKTMLREALEGVEDIGGFSGFGNGVLGAVGANLCLGWRRDGVGGSFSPFDGTIFLNIEDARWRVDERILMHEWTHALVAAVEDKLEIERESDLISLKRAFPSLEEWLHSGVSMTTGEREILRKKERDFFINNSATYEMLDAGYKEAFGDLLAKGFDAFMAAETEDREEDVLSEMMFAYQGFGTEIDTEARDSVRDNLKEVKRSLNSDHSRFMKRAMEQDDRERKSYWARAGEIVARMAEVSYHDSRGGEERPNEPMYQNSSEAGASNTVIRKFFAEALAILRDEPKRRPKFK